MSNQQEEIRFYNDTKNPYFALSNYYPIKKTETLLIGKKQKKKSFKSVEHYIQYKKFSRDHKQYSREIVCTKTPHKARLLGSKGGVMKRDWRGQANIKAIFNEPEYADVKMRADWDTIKDFIMKKAVYQKFSQNPKLRKLLLSTKEKELIEDSPTDYHDGTGLNILGKILMNVRKELAFIDLCQKDM